MSDKVQREAALKRRFGMMPERSVTLSKFNEAQTNWTARCRVCKETLSGTLTELRKHRHDEPSK